MSFEKRNKKHLNTWLLFFQLVILLIMFIGFKFINNAILGNDAWLEKINSLISSGVNEKWFGNFDLASVFVGPIGFKSVITFKTVFGTETALPILIDFIINWAIIMALVLYLIAIIFSFKKESRINRILKKVKIEKDTIHPEPLLETTKEPKLVVKPEPIVVKSVPKKVKKIKLKPVVAKKQTTKSPIAKSNKSASFEIVQVTKKHYEQTSKAEILAKLHSMFPDETKTAIKNTVEAVFEIIAETLSQKEEVSIYGFGKLENQHKNARDGINPLTGEYIKILATNSVKFKAAKQLKEEMSKQKWTGLYTVDKEVEKQEDIFAPKVEEIKVEEVKNNFESKQDTETYLSSLETKYQNVLKVKNNPKITEGLSLKERAKLDGSDSIIEDRSELQKHANSIRKVALANNLRKTLREVNLRDMTKKELVTYMQKVRKEVIK